ncbi:ABC transporter [Orenia metallireducens]|jgi:iron complex transport system ATP-binding protein|uniref:ABC transporter n=1 Tax=Orenia metallireducens TaxID=1413210 RepID=A0A1C0ACK7_9FIRM|nr:heme ABC transporter ATP-binding protein [Orenia metallireducens]OCL28112.1 ABC transporter [Orenia metallireducens]
MNILKVNNLSFSYGEAKLIKDVSFTVERGELFGIIGPNGSGKSTLLKLLSNIIKKEGGEIFLLGKELNQYRRKELAKVLAVLPQSTEVNFDFSVKDIVEMGRHPYLRNWQGITQVDKRVIERALRLTNTIDLVDKSINSISGGERQRVLLARALVQEAELLLLDEPTSALDINYQIEIFELLVKLRKEGTTIVVVLHDLNLASQYCDRLLLLNQGKINTVGSPSEVITLDNIKDVYGCDVKIDNSSSRPYLKLVSSK